MKKIIALVLCLVFVLTCFAGCAGKTQNDAPANAGAPAAADSGAADDEIYVGYAVMRLVDEYWDLQIKGIRQALEDSGLNVKFEIADCNNESQKTIENVESLLSRGIDILLISSPDENLASTIIELAKAKNVPVITSDVTLEGDDVFVTKDFYNCGKLVGDYAADFFLETCPGVTPVVSVLTHAALANTVNQNINGFTDAFKAKIPDAKFIEVQDAEGLRDKANTIAADIITANPDVNIIFGINDDIAMGAASAVEAAGKSGKIFCFGQGGVGETVFQTLENEGPFVATSSDDPYGHGYSLATEALIPVIKGEEVAEVIMTPSVLATKETAHDFLVSMYGYE